MKKMACNMAVNKFPIVLFIFAFCLLSYNFSFAQSPNWLWANSASGISSEQGNSISVDLNGNSFATGWFKSPTLTFGSFVLTNTDSTGITYDIFVAKYDGSGNIDWAKRFGTPEHEVGYSICADTAGNIYFTGSFSGPVITFDTITLNNNSPGYPDCFIVKFNTNGNIIWAKNVGGLGADVGKSIKVDITGNIYVTGTFNSSTISFGNNTLTSSGNTNIFVVKYDSTGNALWAKSASETSSGIVNNICVDVFGNVFIIGFFDQPTITFGAFTLTNAAVYRSDIFIVKYDVFGNVIWAKSASGSDNDSGYGINTDTNGNAYLTGYFMSPSLSFDTITLLNVNNTNTDCFLVKFNTAGNVIWAKSFGGTDNETGTAIVNDAIGNSYVTGSFFSPSISFGATTLFNFGTGSSDIFVSKFDSSGNSLWAKSAGGNSSDVANSIYKDANDNLYIAGNFGSSTVAFGNDTLLGTLPYGASDFFIAKLDNVITGTSELPVVMNNFNLYPNPVQNELFIESNFEGTQKFEIFNIVGQIIYSYVVDKKAVVNMTNLPNGVYLIKLNTGKSTIVKKFVKE